jgi:dsDNA-specific endonuclease/ATPase MutS2
MPRRPGPGPDELDADLLDADLLDADLLDADLLGTPSAPGAPSVHDDAVVPPLTDELDLHTFQPRDCADLVAEYLQAAQAAGLPRVRIIHGKGTGALRRIVHGVLGGHPAVRAYQLADERSGSWGATLVEIQPPPG